jgi:hypothetical protein
VEVGGWKCALRILVQFYTINNELLKALEYIRIIQKNIPGDMVHTDTMKWCFFFGIGVPKQSYEDAQQFGLEAQMCVRGTHGDFHLLVIVRMIHLYFPNDANFVLSLRRVCRSWNAVIQKCGEFWERFPLLVTPQVALLKTRFWDLMRERGARSLRSLEKQVPLLEKYIGETRHSLKSANQELAKAQSAVSVIQVVLRDQKQELEEARREEEITHRCLKRLRHAE